MNDQTDEKPKLSTLIANDLSKLKYLAEVVSSIFGLMTPALAVGTLIMASYCLSTGIVPRGLTFGDTAAALVVTLAFGLFYLFSVGASLCSMIWIVALLCGARRSWDRLRRSLSKSRRPRAAPSADAGRPLPQLKRVVQSHSTLLGSFFLCAIIAFLFLPLANNPSSGGRRLLMLLGVFVVSGFALAAVSFVDKGDHDKPSRRKLLGLLALILAPAIALPDVLIDVTMGLAGIRHNRKAVIIDAKNLGRLQIAADSVRAPLTVCRPPHGTEYIVLNVDLQWHGIGDTTYARLVVDDGDWNRPPHFVTAELETNGISLLRSNLEIACPASAESSAHPKPVIDPAMVSN